MDDIGFTVGDLTGIKVGDVFTISGVNAMRRNPDRRWWQLWKPKLVSYLDESKYQAFRVSHTSVSNPL